MANISTKKIVCAFCGTQNEVEFSLSSFSPYIDLDTRPNGTARNNYIYKVNICSNCGFSSNNIEDITDIEKEIISAENYKKLLNAEEFDDIIRKFLAAAHINEYNKDYKNAAFYYLYLAWYHDDNENEDLAKISRYDAIRNLEEYLYIAKKSKRHDIDSVLLIIDLYRRNGDHSKCIRYAKKLLKKVKRKDENYKNIIKLQIELSKNNDEKRHTTREIK